MKFKKYLSESIADAEEGIIDVLGNSEKTKDEVYKIIKRKYGLKRYEFNDAWKDMVKDGDISKVGGNKYTVESTILEDTPYVYSQKNRLTKIAKKFKASISFKNFQGGSIQGILEFPDIDSPLTVHIPDEYAGKSREYSISYDGKRYIGKTFQELMSKISKRGK
jgi:hypothetical protein